MSEKTLSWTDAQRAAIEARATNVLVAASAGTGKTAVLVERCIQLVTAPGNPIDIDRLLVVTFTEAAAAEMRSRISEALRRKIDADPGSVRLRRQLMLLDRAPISTLHSFALRTLQEHFFRIGLDPNLAVMDADDSDLLRAETLDEVFERLYTDESQTGEIFRQLVSRQGQQGDDQPVRQAVLGLSDFLRSQPWPKDWREQVRAYYAAADRGGRFKRLAWYKPFVQGLGEDLARLEVEARVGASGRGACSLPEPYVAHFHATADSLEALRRRLESDGFDPVQQATAEFEFPRLAGLKGIDESVREAVKKRNDHVKGHFRKRVRDGWCAFSGDQWVETIRATRPDVEALFEVVRQFDHAYDHAKRERSEVDFHDLERLCFDLLIDPAESSPERLAPSAAAVELQERFEEVLVDEYQDINPLQDAILELASRQSDPARPRNLFLVGDVKQSIYRFRLAEPAIFLKKFNTYVASETTGGKIRIDLNENFRSRPPLLGALNALFEQIMVREVGGIAYDEAAALKGGLQYPDAPSVELPPPSAGAPIEVHLFDRAVSPIAQIAEEDDDAQTDAAAPDDPVAELEQIEVEASWVAQRAREMVAQRALSVWDRGAGCYRSVAYRDIAVLLLTAVYKADVFVRMLRAHGVPAYTEAGSGSLLATEMMDMLSLLELLDNPRQDIALAAVLRSPLVGLSEDDLARVRMHHRKGDFFSAAVAYAAKGPTKPLRQRLSAFLGHLEHWRSLARRGPLAKAIWTIFDETGYLDYVTAMPDGAQRRANLVGLYDRARQFDEFSRRGLGRFLEFIRRLQETEGQLGAPSAFSEAEDVVRVMSIHKSKGLEFPVVFLADIGKAFNLESVRGNLIADRQLGVAVRGVNVQRGFRFPTAAHLVVARQLERETLAENLRLLYVATTRAREKLLLCGSVRLEQAGRQWAGCAAGQDPRGPLDCAAVASAKSFADWVGPALARLGCLNEDGQPGANESNGPFVVHFHDAEEWRQWRQEHPVAVPDKKEAQALAALQPVAAGPHDAAAVARVLERLRWQYRWRPLADVRGKFSVTELKRRFETGREGDETAREHLAAAMTRRPCFLASGRQPQETLTAAEIGTAYHTILRHLDLHQLADEQTVLWQIEDMTRRGLLTPLEAATVDVQPIVQLLRAPLGLEMRRRPGRVRREVPFSLAVRADEIETALPAELAEDEWVHVQGVIDCLIERPRGLAVIDFKTDRIGPEAVFAQAERYRVQMAYYARAAATIFRRPVLERTVYFLMPAVAVEVGGGKDELRVPG